MKSIVEENLVSFKSLEQKIFAYVCELGRKITQIMLESYDAELAEERDKRQYRDKGKRTTTIKTVYGKVTYARRVYQTRMEDGRTAYVYLLDEAMHMDKIGLISTNLAEKIAMTVTESPYRVTAEAISETCGQRISHGAHGIWCKNWVSESAGKKSIAQNRWKPGSQKGRKGSRYYLKRWMGYGFPCRTVPIRR